MIRQNSIDSFNTIRDNGLLSERRFQVYEILYEHGPLIGSKVSMMMKSKHGVQGTSESVRNRLTELRGMGCVYERGLQIDNSTGNTVILWDVTSDLPRKLIKKSKQTHIINVCNMCGRSWKDSQTTHENPEGQFCFGELNLYKFWRK